MAERAGHRVVVAARAASYGRRACQFAVEFRHCHELVCSFPVDEAARPGSGYVCLFVYVLPAFQDVMGERERERERECVCVLEPNSTLY